MKIRLKQTKIYLLFIYMLSKSKCNKNINVYLNLQNYFDFKKKLKKKKIFSKINFYNKVSE